ncbi:lipoyl(octanoyl) transferase LipB [Gilvimarinus polysaccharolyticus]|uniref:lipoyl(octanoyl) transferase LipB n=1 Tax=Gilvimarinus polysaccharolyticus TaxID=863921 RepID=UPI00067376C2|nr:lipoyl(octanoyl) transferase LipB [Gilvimarinus polysaccharolyticus]
MPLDQLDVHDLGTRDYLSTWQAMSAFTSARASDAADQLWLVEHPAVFTQGQAGKPEHLLAVEGIELVQSDRGGQVTYHGPGQLVAYPLLDLRRRKLGVRQLVSLIEQVIIAVLHGYDIDAYARPDAPGVYVAGDKIASLGLRVRRGCSFHGLALNVDMDLSPFEQINPCGYAGLKMTDMARLRAVPVAMSAVKNALIDQFVQKLDYKTAIISAA